MNTKYVRQRFVSGWLVILSVTALALLGLQFWTSTLGSPGCMLLDEHTDSRLVGGGFYWWTTIVQAFLLLNLAVSAVVLLFSFQLSRRSDEAKRYLTPRPTSPLPAVA